MATPNKEKEPIFNPNKTLPEILLSLGKLFLIIGIGITIFFGPKPYDTIALILIVAWSVTKELFSGIKFAKEHTIEESVAQFIIRLLSFIIFVIILAFLFH